MRGRQSACCFTGHRPGKLPWRYNEEDLRCVSLMARIADAVEAEDALAEIQVTAQGHAAEKVAEPLLIGGLHRVGDAALQGQTPGVLFIIPPGQLAGPVPGEAAGPLPSPHDSPLPLSCWHQYRTSVWICKGKSAK